MKSTHLKANLREMISEVLKAKKENRKVGKEVLVKVHQIIKKKSLYDELKRELNYKTSLNELYRVYYEQIVDLKNDIKQSKETMEIVCKRIKKECKSYLALMNDYDKKIEELRMKNQADSRKYNEGIAAKEKEHNDLLKMLNDTIEKTKQQEIKIKEDMDKIKDHDKLIQRERDSFLQIETAELKKISMMKDNINRLNEFLSIKQRKDANVNDSVDTSQRVLHEEEMKM